MSKARAGVQIPDSGQDSIVVRNRSLWWYTAHMDTTPANPAPLSENAREALRAIYREVDEDIAATGAVCHRRGRCCDFLTNDHRLFASSVELAYIRERHPAPLGDGVLCPFWKNRLCAERERRPLGCRTYFCDERMQERAQAIYESFHRKIKKLAESHGLPYSYEPFVGALRAGT